MKKHNEGYVLAMVMVVIAVLAVVASAMLAVGLRNVQTQQAAVSRMQDKYAAEGAIEVVVAQLSNMKKVDGTGENAAINELKEEMKDFCENYGSDNVTVIPRIESNEFEITSKSNATKIECRIKLGYIAKKDQISEGEKETFTASVNSVEYVFYEISTTTAGGAAE